MISVILAKVLLDLLLDKSAAGIVVHLCHFLWCCCDRLLLSNSHFGKSGGSLGRLSLHGHGWN